MSADEPWTAPRLACRQTPRARPAIAAELQDSVNRLARTFLACAIALLVGATVLPSNVSAHSGKQSYLYLTILDDGIEGRIEYPVRDLAAATGIEGSVKRSSTSSSATRRRTSASATERRTGRSTSTESRFSQPPARISSSPSA